MIIAFVQFKLPAPMTQAEATKLFEKSAANYRHLPGLIRKHYVLSDDGLMAISGRVARRRSKPFVVNGENGSVRSIIRTPQSHGSSVRLLSTTPIVWLGRVDLTMYRWGRSPSVK
jgi:hypothetical protein